MKVIKNQEFGGERPLFESHGLRLENVSIHEGESAIKECSDIEAEDCFSPWALALPCGILTI